MSAAPARDAGERATRGIRPVVGRPCAGATPGTRHERSSIISNEDGLLMVAESPAMIVKIRR
ncbi:MAG TPA: hypothetical protein VNT03_02455 [Baekduia sp.]|nr:hypothetical protein [Baekduia sp.]